MRLRSVLAVATLTIGFIASPSASATTNICLAYDTGGLGDRSYNDASLAGVKMAENQYSFTLESVVTDGTAADRDIRLRTLMSRVVPQSSPLEVDMPQLFPNWLQNLQK